MDSVQVRRVSVSTPPAVRPVTMQQARDHLNILDDEEDGKLSMLLDAAVGQVEDDTGVGLCTRTNVLKLDAFPAGGFIRLPVAPLQSVTSVYYTPLETDTPVLLSSASYRVDTDSKPGRIWLRDAYDWPTDELIEANGVSITYVAGYGTGASGISGTVTMTIAAPGVVTWTAHELLENDAVTITTTGALPTGITAGTVYYVRDVTTNTFKLASTRGGSAITTTGSQSGTHTATLADGRPSSMPHGLVHAILLLVGHWFANREATTDQSSGNVSKLVMGYEPLINQHRLEWFA